jgi:hypothetical protein
MPDRTTLANPMWQRLIRCLLVQLFKDLSPGMTAEAFKEISIKEINIKDVEQNRNILINKVQSHRAELLRALCILCFGGVTVGVTSVTAWQLFKFYTLDRSGLCGYKDILMPIHTLIAFYLSYTWYPVQLESWDEFAQHLKSLRECLGLCMQFNQVVARCVELSSPEQQDAWRALTIDLAPFYFILPKSNSSSAPQPNTVDAAEGTLAPALGKR